MDFELTQEQQMLADSAAKFAKSSSPLARMRTLRSHGKHGEHELGWEPKVWREMADLGWLGLVFPEEIGGLGLGFFDASLVVEKLATTLVPEPFVPSVLVAGSAVMAGSLEQQKRFLSPMIEGKTTLALAWAERRSRYATTEIETRAKADGDALVITGEKVWVLHGHAADVLVVSAKQDGALVLVAIEKGAAGLSIESVKTMDGQRAAFVKLDGVRVPKENVLAHGSRAELALELALDRGAAAACAEGYGIASAVLWMTVGYLGVRKQFGVAIGSFQALQHRAVDMFVETELLRSAAMLACARVDDPDVQERRRAVSIAKAQLEDGGRFVVQQATQLHGGIGVTDEHDVGLFFKRMTVLHGLYGDAQHHLERFASSPSFAAVG